MADTESISANLGKGLIAVISATVGVAAKAVIDRQRPKHLLVTDLDHISLMQLDDDIRPRITARFDDHPVQRLGYTTFAITNTDNSARENCTLRFSFAPGTKMLHCEFAGVENLSVDSSTPDVCVLTIPLLNSHRLHEEVIVGRILCDGDFQSLTVTGRGPDWSTKRVNWNAAEIAPTMWVPVAGLAMILLLCLGGVCAEYVLPMLPPDSLARGLVVAIVAAIGISPFLAQGIYERRCDAERRKLKELALPKRHQVLRRN